MNREEIAQLKLKIKQNKKIEKNDKFYNDLVVSCLMRDIDVVTLYKIIKIKNIDQMLSVMPKTVISEYDLHLPTLQFLTTTSGCKYINSQLHQRGYKYTLSQLQIGALDDENKDEEKL